MNLDATDDLGKSRNQTHPDPALPMNTTDQTTAPAPRPIMGDKMTDSERTACLAALRDSAVDICKNVGIDLAGHLLAQAHKLDNSELLQITRGSIQFNRGVRILLVVLAADRIAQQWATESTSQDVKRVRRWLKNRY